MDWSKTKNILIVALVMTNLILGYYVWHERLPFDKQDYNMRIEDLQNILMDHHIDVSSLNPDIVSEMPVVFVAFKQQLLYEIAPTLLGESTQDPQGRYVSQDYLLGLKDPYTLELVRKEGAKGFAVDTAEEWIREHFAYTEDFVLTDTRETDKGILYQYTQQVNDFFLEGSYMKLLVQDNRIVTFERKWYDVTLQGDQTIQVAPYAVVLYRLMDVIFEVEPSFKDVLIEKVALGYKLESTLFDMALEAGEASPYFKFYSRSGRTYLVQALWTD
jgi:hypothetical protein